jgi:hypothetical protein
MYRVGFETTAPVFERVKTSHVLDRVATVIDPVFNYKGWKFRQNYTRPSFFKFAYTRNDVTEFVECVDFKMIS